MYLYSHFGWIFKVMFTRVYLSHLLVRFNLIIGQYKTSALSNSESTSIINEGLSSGHNMKKLRSSSTYLENRYGQSDCHCKQYADQIVGKMGDSSKLTFVPL